MKEYRVAIPQEDLYLIDFSQEGQPGVGVVNAALHQFEPKVVFSWHLSVMIEFADLIDNGMPSKSERELVDPFCDRVDSLIKGTDGKRPNALFLARLTWNETRELIWRVHDPEAADGILQGIIEEHQFPRPFNYEMEHDPEWEKTKWHLKDAESNR
ncbi:hypothetical protein KOR42_33660 [Thalassoglobus neptunius]|uniref:DUF695 domain-containing protein n=1 Tax=Thalassoglobus neptunius TaxID=1938619 RepID=A0A5C5WQ07_9PLAN|nr:DUF695 domain-containing protein [Thalassoglobus neptunius]TWT51892.1 hypothetical protein KOR42_33660 [Thalassoglobus neptunius]